MEPDFFGKKEDNNLESCNLKHLTLAPQLWTLESLQEPNKTQ